MKENFKVVMTENKTMDNNIEMLLEQFDNVNNTLIETKEHYEPIIANGRQAFLNGVAEQIDDLVETLLTVCERIGVSRMQHFEPTYKYIYCPYSVCLNVGRNGNKWELRDTHRATIMTKQRDGRVFFQTEDRLIDKFFGDRVDSILTDWDKCKIFEKLYNSIIKFIEEETKKKKQEIEEIYSDYNRLNLEIK